MKQPPGFVAQEKCGKICRLRKSLYGLKQSPQAWFGKFIEAIKEFEMERVSLITQFSIYTQNPASFFS